MQGSLLLSTLLAAAATESSLLQEASTAVKPDGVRSKPLAGLLESAKSFLANGATPDTVTFVEETLKEVEQIIIPAIVQESEEDKDWMDTEHKKFDDALKALKLGKMQIINKRSQVLTASRAHKKCRKAEETECKRKRNCEIALHDLWESWATAENELKMDHETFDLHFCAHDANGTLATFRDGSVTPMQEWVKSKKICDSAAKAYDLKVPDCDTANEQLDTKSAQCNTAQTALEGTACDAEWKYHETMTNFHTTWASLHSSYQGITDLVYQQTEDRKLEHRTLKVVQCLLDRVHEQNGRPCDETTGGVSDVVGTCEQEGMDLDVCKVCAALKDEDGKCPEDEKNICPEYLYPPPAPDFPDPKPYPCESEWMNAEMGVPNLPKLPTPPFHSENPGCNQYPPCTDCPDGKPKITVSQTYGTWIPPSMSFQVDEYGNQNRDSGAAHATFGDKATEYARTNSLRAAAVDGCGEELPLVVKYADDTAAIRCCTDDGCTTPGAADDTCNLYDKATLHDANAVCENLGMRLCTQAEMGQGSKCCGTGCGFDAEAVWISDAMTSED